MIILKKATVMYNKKNYHDKFIKNIILKGIARKFKRNSSKENNNFFALSNINFTFKKGDKVAFIGKNGSGKTTILKLLSREIPPTRGSVINEYQINSFIDPKGGMNPMSTGLENVIMKFYSNFIEPEPDLVEKVKEFSELKNFFYQPIHTYSAGMVMRLAFSILINIQKPIIIMDEWLSVGDEDFKKKAEKALKEYIQNQEMLFLATHSEKLANSICNIIITLENGKLNNVNYL